MKYVFLEKKNKGDNTATMYPIIFPNGLIHADIAEAVCVFIKEKYGDDLFVTSAGEIYVGVSSVGGNSTTLQLAARPEDKGYINTIDYMHTKEISYKWFKYPEERPKDGDEVEYKTDDNFKAKGKYKMVRPLKLDDAPARQFGEGFVNEEGLPEDGVILWRPLN